MQGTALLSASIIALAASTPVLAQNSTTTPAPAARDAEDIIVTATKREQTLQDVPISVSVTKPGDAGKSANSQFD